MWGATILGPSETPWEVRAGGQPAEACAADSALPRSMPPPTHTHSARRACAQGGMFQLRITFSESYPEKPPRVRFTSEIFHPNVYSDGTLCLDIIQDSWSPCHNICSILTSIQSLLTDPNCSSPANPEAAQVCTRLGGGWAGRGWGARGVPHASRLTPRQRRLWLACRPDAPLVVTSPPSAAVHTGPAGVQPQGASDIAEERGGDVTTPTPRDHRVPHTRCHASFLSCHFLLCFPPYLPALPALPACFPHAIRAPPPPTWPQTPQTPDPCATRWTSQWGPTVQFLQQRTPVVQRASVCNVKPSHWSRVGKSTRPRPRHPPPATASVTTVAGAPTLATKLSALAGAIDIEAPRLQGPRLPESLRWRWRAAALFCLVVASMRWYCN